MLIKRLNLTEHGICIFVGSLEATILYALWDIDTPIPMARLYRYLIEHRKTETSYSTIITTCNRMFAKQLITRTERENHTPLWSSAFESEDHFIEIVMIDTLNVLRDNYSEHVLAYCGE